MTITKQDVLHKTHYGTNIYAHILRLYYPDEVVMTIKGRDCGIVRNPFNFNKPTLHIWIKKADPSNALSAEIARHEDTENAIPTGNAFSFAELHYKQKGDELLETLNQELHLRIGEEKRFYKSNSKKSNQGNQINPINQSPYIEFSFFKAPVSNTKPHSKTTLKKVYNTIVGSYYKERTEKLRVISDAINARKFKAANFDYCTFSGIFSTRNEKSIIKHSGLLCIDFDHLKAVDLLRNQLLNDEYFDTQLLFVSPSGNGLKWIIKIDISEVSHADYFNAVANYIKTTYNIEIDKSGKDTSRACFLPHDPQAFINPQIINSSNSQN